MGCSSSGSSVMIAMLTTHCSELHCDYKTKGCECWLWGQHHCVSNEVVNAKQYHLLLKRKKIFFKHAK